MPYVWGCHIYILWKFHDVWIARIMYAVYYIILLCGDVFIN